MAVLVVLVIDIKQITWDHCEKSHDCDFYVLLATPLTVFVGSWLQGCNHVTARCCGKCATDAKHLNWNGITVRTL